MNINLTWTASTQGTYPIAGYYIYDASDDSLLVDLAGEVYSYTIEDIEFGTYSYYARAYDSQGNESVNSNVVELEYVLDQTAMYFDGGVYLKGEPTPNEIEEYTLTFWLRKEGDLMLGTPIEQNGFFFEFREDEESPETLPSKLIFYSASAISSLAAPFIEQPDANRWFFVSVRYDAANGYMKADWGYLEDVTFPSDRHLESQWTDPVDGDTEDDYYNADYFALVGGIVGAMTQARQWLAALSDAEILAEKNSATAVRTADLYSSNPMSNGTDLSDESGNDAELAIDTGTPGETEGPGNA